MFYPERIAHHDVQQPSSDVQTKLQKKMTTGEYRQILRQQYERLAQHQQVIEAEWHADELYC